MSPTHVDLWLNMHKAWLRMKRPQLDSVSTVCAGVHAPGRRAARHGVLRLVAAGVVPHLRHLPRHHVLLHLLLVQGRAAALRPPGWSAQTRQPGQRPNRVAVLPTVCLLFKCELKSLSPPCRSAL